MIPSDKKAVKLNPDRSYNPGLIGLTASCLNILFSFVFYSLIGFILPA